MLANVPVSHKASKLGIAIAGEQLDAVGGHGVEKDSECVIAL